MSKVSFLYFSKYKEWNASLDQKICVESRKPKSTHKSVPIFSISSSQARLPFRNGVIIYKCQNTVQVKTKAHMFWGGKI